MQTIFFDKAAGHMQVQERYEYSSFDMLLRCLTGEETC